MLPIIDHVPNHFFICVTTGSVESHTSCPGIATAIKAPFVEEYEEETFVMIATLSPDLRFLHQEELLWIQSVLLEPKNKHMTQT